MQFLTEEPRNESTGTTEPCTQQRLYSETRRQDQQPRRRDIGIYRDDRNHAQSSSQVQSHHDAAYQYRLGREGLGRNIVSTMRCGHKNRKSRNKTQQLLKKQKTKQKQQKSIIFTISLQQNTAIKSEQANNDDTE